MDLFRQVRLGQVPLVARPSQSIFPKSPWTPANRLSGSPRRRLGSPQNRLLQLPFSVILSRRDVGTFGERQRQETARESELERTRATFINQGWPFQDPGFPYHQPGSTPKDLFVKFFEWPPEYVDAVLGMIRNPPSEELEDVALIDSFFGAGETSGGSTIVTQRDLCVKEGGVFKSPPGTIGERAYSLSMGSFLCPSIDDGLYTPGNATHQMISFEPWLNLGYEPTSHSQWRTFPPRMVLWQVNPETTWGEVKPYAQNMVTIDRTIRDYPWPTGIREFSWFWTRLVLPELRELAKTPGLNSDFVRFWITMTIVANAEQFQAEIADYVDDQAHKDKIRARMKMIAGIALGALFSVFAPALIAQGFSAIQQGLSVMQKREAAVELERAAEQMASQDDAFAGELQHASDVLEFFADEAARVGERAKSAEELAKEVESAVGGPSVGDIAIIGAVGLAVAVGIGYLVTEVL